MPRRWVGAAVRSRSSPASVSAASAPRRSLGQRDALDEAVVDQAVDQPRGAALREGQRRRRGGPSAAGGRAPRRGSAGRRTPGATGRARPGGPRRAGARRAPGRGERAPRREARRRGARERRRAVGRRGRWQSARRQSYGPDRCAVNESPSRRGSRPASIGEAMTTFDVDAIRARFPALALTTTAGRWSSSTAPAAPRSRSRSSTRSTRYYRESNANHGGAFPTSRALGRDRRRRPRGDGRPARRRRRRDQARAEHDDADVPHLALDRRDDARRATRSSSPASTTRRTSTRGSRAARDNEAIVRTWEPRLDDCTLDLDGPRRAAQRADAARRRRLGVERRRHDQPDRRDRRRGPTPAGAWTTSTRSTPRRTCRSTPGRSAPTSSPARSTSSSGRTSACSTAGARSSTRCPTYKVRPAAHRFETGHRQLRGRRRGASPRSSTSRTSGVRYGGAAASATPRASASLAGMPAIRAYEMDLYRHLAARPRGDRRACGSSGSPPTTTCERRTPTAAITIEGVTPARRRRGARAARASPSGTATSTRPGSSSGSGSRPTASSGSA